MEETHVEKPTFDRQFFPFWVLFLRKSDRSSGDVVTSVVFLNCRKSDFFYVVLSEPDLRLSGSDNGRARSLPSERKAEQSAYLIEENLHSVLSVS